MTKSTRSSLASALICATLMATGASPAAAQVAAYLSNPTALQTDYNTGVDGVRTNTFDGSPWASNTTYTASIPVPSFGTYEFSSTNQGNVFNNGTVTFEGIGYTNSQQYGNTTGNFLGFGNFWTGNGTAQTGASIDFGAAQRYFGFAWNAGDGGNTISFYSNGTLIAFYNTSQTIGVIPRTAGTTVTNGDGQTFNTIDYYGQPGTGLNATESYTYLNFFGTNGVTFDRVVLSNVGTTGFESDNHSVSTETLTPRGTFVPAGFAVAIVPESGTVSLLALPFLAGVCAVVIRRRK